MIVKMTILRLLGSSDDKYKEKIGKVRPEGPPLRFFRYAMVLPTTNGCTDAHASVLPVLPSEELSGRCYTYILFLFVIT